MMKVINIADDFTRYPGGRYRKHGKGSGEEFREHFLLPSLQSDEPITVVLDGAAGYSSSFLEEAFGGLVRMGYSQEVLHKLISFKAGGAFRSYETLIWKYVDAAKPAGTTH